MAVLWRSQNQQDRTSSRGRGWQVNFRFTFICFEIYSFFRFKGKAFIIVDGKRDAAIETLAHVLAKNDNILMGRRVRIEIYQVRASERGFSQN